MLTALLVTLGMGYTIHYEDAVAANVTIIPTEDNRVRYSAVTYTDGITCIVSRYDKSVRYNTVADAEAAWNAKAPPFKSIRGHTAFIESDICGAFLRGAGDIGLYAYVCYFLLILGIPLDCRCIDICIRYTCIPLYEECKQHYGSTMRHAILPCQTDITPVTITVLPSSAPPPIPPEGATAAESR